MNIKIDLVISANPELLTFLQLLTSGKSVWQDKTIIPPIENGETQKTEPVEAKKTRAKKIEYAPGGPAPEKIQLPSGEQVIAPVIEKAEVKTDLTQEMIIADAVPKSKAGHKDKIKAKVTELGYESITDLQPEHFNEFYAFLQTIPKP